MAKKRKKKRTRNPASPAAGTRNTASEPATEVEREPDEPKRDTPVGQSEEPDSVAPSDDLEAVHKEAIERYEQGWLKDRENQSRAYDDLRFLCEEVAQWDSRALADRRNENRPVLTVNKCPQFVRQVTGDIRQLRPAVRVVPVHEQPGQQPLGVEVLPEMVRYIERRSDAKGAYFHAADQMVAAGVGHARVYTEYASATTMNQEIAIGLIPDGICIVWDPDSIMLNREDAMFCFVPVDLNKKRAEKKWPNKRYDALTRVSEAFDGWSTDEHVRVAEYWRKVPIERELAIYPNGAIVDLTDDTYEAETGKEPQPEDDYEEEEDTSQDDGSDKPTHEEANYRPGEGDRRCANCTMFRPPSHCTAIQDPVRADMLCDFFEPAVTLGMMGGEEMPTLPQRPPLGPGMGPKRADAIAAGATIEKRDSFKVERYIMSAGDILKGPEEFHGTNIPIAPFFGEEVMIGRQIIRRGIVRPLKDVQRLYNYAVSADAEAVALQPKAPFIGTRKNFENFLDQWETANQRNWPFLEFDPDAENGGAAPQRSPPPVASTGIKELLAVATADMSGVTGIYPASLGQAGPETSGKAITARQREGDTGTFHYVEAFARGIERIGQIVVDLIPYIYDTPRTLRIVGEDGKPTKLDVNKEIIDPNGDGIATVMFNDLTVGEYDVTVQMGPSFSTQREEARDGMETLMKALGQQVAPLLADLYVEAQDFPLSGKIAKRLQHLLPPPIAAAEAAARGEPPPPPQPPPQPTPEQQLQLAELEQKKREGEAKAALEMERIAAQREQVRADLIQVNVALEQARMTHEQTIVSHAAKAREREADSVDSVLDRQHEREMAGHEAGMTMMNAANGGGNGETVVRPDEQQQLQIDALIEAVAQLQQAVVHIAEAASVPKPPAPSPEPMPPPPGPSPGPGPVPPGPMAPFVGEPVPPEETPPGAPPAI